MSFQSGQATEFREKDGVAVLSRAFRKVGRPVALVPLGAGIHAGHLAMVRAAKRIPTAIVIVAVEEGVDISPLKEEQVDAVFFYNEEILWPHGQRTLVQPPSHQMEDARGLALELTERVALVNMVQPSDVFFGEKDFELLIATQHAFNDLHISSRIHGVPTVRMPDGLAISLRNTTVSEAAHDQALVLSAALTAGAYAAEDGAEKVIEVATSVLTAAGITPEYLELRGLDLGQAPVEGNARLFIAAEVGGVRLIDNAGVPVGIGFRNLGEQE
ncbi:Pantothenate synthetase [Corynebacterium occultum]|uniref:pantoate--beta-alanine ligase (AMP-forming) n=1 Tax=Corynebacterium occultum TaxID=2675219 RepID=A0A6B8WBT4_9CORY|nr:pantoate--beta-alanine ligase [Corynebacterium occultum]QGU08316.1 Pantothenate synthetase [Corynebacterium occultum]